MTMSWKTALAVAALSASSVVLALPVLADAPSTGVVVEGESVPGIALGSTRAEVETAYGEPYTCSKVLEPGDQGRCRFLVADGGAVDVSFWGADGSGPSAADDDVVTRISWTEQVSGWTTTAGINTAIARADREAVVAAYPNARVFRYDSGFREGVPYRVIDYEQGVEIEWVWIIYAGRDFVRMSIFEPGPTPPLPPPVEQRTYVWDIDLAAAKDKKYRKLTAFVRVREETHLAAAGATVHGTWIGPGGIKNDAPDASVTSSSGNAYFELTTRDRGTFMFVVEDVILDDHRFDRANSVTAAQIKVT
jgi:hypothetical protein